MSIMEHNFKYCGTCFHTLILQGGARRDVEIFLQEGTVLATWVIEQTSFAYVLSRGMLTVETASCSRFLDTLTNGALILIPIQSKLFDFATPRGATACRGET